MEDKILINILLKQSTPGKAIDKVYMFFFMLHLKGGIFYLHCKQTLDFLYLNEKKSKTQRDKKHLLKLHHHSFAECVPISTK